MTIITRGMGAIIKKAPKKKWKKSEHMGWTKKEVELEMGWRSLENPNKKIGKKEFYKQGNK